MNEMSMEEARVEAKRRFGIYGVVRIDGPNRYVGRVPFGSFGMDIYGSGKSWEEAFANVPPQMNRKSPA